MLCIPYLRKSHLRVYIIDHKHDSINNITQYYWYHIIEDWSCKYLELYMSWSSQTFQLTSTQKGFAKIVYNCWPGYDNLINSLLQSCQLDKFPCSCKPSQPIIAQPLYSPCYTRQPRKPNKLETSHPNNYHRGPITMAATTWILCNLMTLLKCQFYYSGPICWYDPKKSSSLDTLGMSSLQIIPILSHRCSYLYDLAFLMKFQGT